MKILRKMTIVAFVFAAMLLPLHANTCLDFDGVDDYVEVPHDASLNLTTSMTFEYWVNFNQVDRTTDGFDWQCFIGKDSFESAFGLMLCTDGPVKSLRFYHSGCSIPYSDYQWNDVQPQTWYHVAITYDGSQTKHYINGQVMDSTAVTGAFTQNSNKLNIGMSESGTTYPVDGKMDEVRLWNIPLTQSDLQANMYNSLTGSETGLVAYYKFEEGSGTIAGDSAGSNDGILINMEDEDWVNSIYPIVVDFTPEDNSVNVGLENDLAIKFDAVMQAGSGNITIYKTSDDSVVETIPAVSTTITDSTVTIDLVNDFGWNTDYYVTIDSLAFMDSDSIYFGGIYDSTTWNFNSVNQFIDINAGLPGVLASSVAWGDYDNDGDLDILLTGYRNSKIYRNDSGSFTDIGAGIPEVDEGSVAWGDYDNDGDLDILLTGYNAGYISKIYRNDSGSFTDIEAILTGVWYSSVAWGDYDNDGDLDILLTGCYLDEAWQSISKIYKNDAGVFTDINAGLTGVHGSSVAWGDYDNDGDLDILLTGRMGSLTGSDDTISNIYRNDAGNFVDIGAGLPGVILSSVAWGDYDNDGDLDILLTGNAGGVYISNIHRNDAGVFTDIEAGLFGADDASVAWGDYDNDGDLDILLTGTYTSKIYRNDSEISNTKPASPVNLKYNLVKNYITLSWDKAVDNETPQNGLSYNVEVITDSTIVTSSSDTSTGYRKIVSIGNSSQNDFYNIDVENFILPQEEGSKNISWKVQAIDHCFAGSEFSESMDTTFTSRDLELITSDEMEADDLLTWEYVFPDSISNYQLQLDEDINFSTPFEEIITLNKEKDSKLINYNIALNELTDFDSLVNNTRYYWRVKPNYFLIESRYAEAIPSFIYNPTYSIPSPVHIEVMGEFVTLSWDIEKNAEKGKVYNVYSTDEPYAEFPMGWNFEATVNSTEWTVKTSEMKKFYCVTATSAVKTEGKDAVKDSESSLK
ncbi:MAG: FG-GAP-like repeat-containing protein [Candidatus Delongbacteria bacterium]|jgi:hypothetical protein|nr:FG-GAP-like repeat-containing protein [Candidatus Delongbacteria bacterium]